MAVALAMLVAALPTAAQEDGRTSLSGRVIDAATGDPVPFVQVVFEGSTVGTVTDQEGRFSISSDRGDTLVGFHMMGYEAASYSLAADRRQRRVKVSLVPVAQTLNEVQISTSRSASRRYRRRNNPAVDLVRNVIKHRDDNRPEARDRYSRQVYEKLTLALDDFHPDYDRNILLRRYAFLAKYTGVTPFDATPILPVSLRETNLRETYCREPLQRRSVVTATAMQGIERMLGEEGLDANIETMFTPVDIYDADITLMLNHFVSPLSPLLAVTFYRYYITDTADVDGQRCVELSFVPVSSESYGFTGRMYIALDSSYALTRYEMSVSPRASVNFVQGLTIAQTYTRNLDGLYLPERCDTYTRFYVSNHMRKLYAHYVRHCTGYDLSDTVSLLLDSLFTTASSRADLPLAVRLRGEETALRRTLPLAPEEASFADMREELDRRSGFRALRAVAEVVFSGYIPTRKQRPQSRFDVGPVFNFISHNQHEGWRIRVGGMTTAALDPRHFAEGYVAYGFGDRHPKFSTTYTYTFNDKHHHPYESPHNLVSLTASHELESPGQAFDNFDRDNILMSNSTSTGVQYVWQAALRVRKEWAVGIGIDSRASLRRYEPAGTLQYLEYRADGSLLPLTAISTAEWSTSLIYSPDHLSDNRRLVGGNSLRLAWDSPHVSLTHTVGRISGGQTYRRTDLTFEKRFWLSSFGHVDLRLHSGIAWERTPFPMLYFPNGNASLFLSQTSFNTMQPMEFITDRYAALFATYHLKGWILGHLPVVRRMGLREVVGFNALYGPMSRHNNPATTDPTGLYRLPDGTAPLGSRPYMEYSIGIENILRFLRVDYVRRLTYTDGISSRGHIRLEFRITL